MYFSRLWYSKRCSLYTKMETESFTVQKQTGLNSLTVAICSTASQNRSLKCVKYRHLNWQVQYTMKTLEVSTDSPTEKPSQQSRTHISPKHNKSQTQKERTKQMVFGYTMRVWTPLWVKINHLSVINLWYHYHTPGRWEQAGWSDLSVTGVPRVESAVWPPTLLADDRAVNETAWQGLRPELAGQVGGLLQFGVQWGALAIWRAIGTAVWTPVPLFFGLLVGQVQGHTALGGTTGRRRTLL